MEMFEHCASISMLAGLLLVGSSCHSISHQIDIESPVLMHKGHFHRDPHNPHSFEADRLPKCPDHLTETYLHLRLMYTPGKGGLSIIFRDNLSP